MIKNWHSVPKKTLNVIDRDMSISFPRNSKVPRSYFIHTHDEVKDNIQYYNSI